MIKILIIEDEEFYAAFLKKIIIKKYHCDRARDGIEAKKLLLKNQSLIQPVSLYSFSEKAVTPYLIMVKNMLPCGRKC